MARKYNCPCCGKELVRIDPNDTKSSQFWCDTCCTGVSIELYDDNLTAADTKTAVVREVRAGQLYRHFKGALYRVIAIAEHTESGQLLVVYHAESAPSKVWVRPMTMFLSCVNREKYPNVEQTHRFELVEK